MSTDTNIESTLIAADEEVIEVPAATGMTARDMNSKYEETTEAGLAISVVHC